MSAREPWEGKPPPHDFDAETTVLSSIMLDAPNTLPVVLEFLRPEHFMSEAHRRIFEAALELEGKGSHVDMVSIGTWLKDRQRIEQVGGLEYLVGIFNVAPATAHVVTHARTVYRKWIHRQLQITLHRALAQSYGAVADEVDFANAIMESIQSIAVAEAQERTRSMRELAREAYKSFQVAAETPDGVTGLSTGLSALDRATTGLHDGDLTIVAARPGMGKSALATGIASHVASQGGGVLMFSLEMPREQVAQRILCSESYVSLRAARAGELGDGDWERVTRAAERVHVWPFDVHDGGGTTLQMIKARSIRARGAHERAERKLRLLVVDYLQLMGTAKADTRDQALGEVTRGLKELAKSLCVPIVCISQLNREVDKRPNKRPMLADLRESGNIEQDADNILFVYRDEYYNRDKSHEKGLAEIIIAKQRNGPTGMVKVMFMKHCARFQDLKEADPEAEDES